MTRSTVGWVYDKKTREYRPSRRALTRASTVWLSSVDNQPPAFAGALIRGLPSVSGWKRQWMCEHRHVTKQEAWTCAATELTRRTEEGRGKVLTAGA